MTLQIQKKHLPVAVALTYNPIVPAQWQDNLPENTEPKTDKQLIGGESDGSEEKS